MNYRQNFDRAFDLSKAGKLKEALEILDLILFDANSDASASFRASTALHAAIAAENLLDQTRAESYYKEALRLKPDFPHALLGLSSLRSDAGDWTGAWAYLNAWRDAAIRQNNSEMLQTANDLADLYRKRQSEEGTGENL
ncbi:MAG: hypothetical protein ABL967_19565 [Bryobacteraceae bacterium]